ncbi:MAG: small ribosomal subunit Rsm22 family protein [Aestuariivirga sp.]|uniref:small ribosomal subunit Rsm22 family protein n=1 Tax=Aestuariivirga sp. TaxID=2650926 RepID=UPI0038CF51B3
MMLPPELQAAIAARLESDNGAGGSRRRSAAALSATYRAGGATQAVDSASYLVARLPATFAAVGRALEELQARRPGFSPASLLDAGSGPGTASWAVTAMWPRLGQITLLDHDPGMLSLAAALGQAGPPALAAARRLMGDIGRLPEGVSADLTIAAYALAELPLARIAEAVRGLWSASRAMLVLVEPGTPQGFARIRAARDALLGWGAVPVAPCPHDRACPVSGSDWCHFRVRLPRSRAHMHAKAATVPFEDEPFAYLIMARAGEPTGGGRIVAPPRQAKPGIDFKLCDDGRIVDRHIARRDTADYRQARKRGWGDLFVPPQHE